MPTRNINLTDHNEAYLAKAMESGRFKNASEIVRAGLRLLEFQGEQEQAKIEALRDAFKEGEDAYARGEYTTHENDADIDSFFDNLALEESRVP